ncbi:MAG: hypothetical protein AAB511_03920 [Patescibacteria group bacterium]
MRTSIPDVQILLHQLQEFRLQRTVKVLIPANCNPEPGDRFTWLCEEPKSRGIGEIEISGTATDGVVECYVINVP